MGSAKDMMMQGDEQVKVAIEICIMAKIMERCPYHSSTVYENFGDIEAAYKLGNHLITKQDAMVRVFNGNRKEMTDAIQKAINTHGDACYECQHDN